MKDQKELEEVFIKKLFDYKLSSGKCLPTVNWSELVVTTVDTLIGSDCGGGMTDSAWRQSQHLENDLIQISPPSFFVCKFTGADCACHT